MKQDCCFPGSFSIFLRFMLVVLLFGPFAYSQQPAPMGLDEFVLGRMQNSHIPGLSLAVVKNRKVILAKGYGIANLETNTPARPDTVYKIASLSKPILSAAVLLLEQEGKLKLDDKVAMYLTDSPTSWNEITIHHLLTHTSGIVRDPSDYHPYQEQPDTDIIKAAYSLPLAFQPGEKWLYSNIGYYVLAEIITRVSGEPWPQFIADRLLVPAHMDTTSLTTVSDIVRNRAAGYKEKDHRLVNAENWIAVRPSGAFLSTVLDLSKWDAFMDSGQVITPENVHRMWTAARLKDGATTEYGLGWGVSSLLGRKRIHHEGQFPGFRSDYEHFSDDQLTVIVLANCDDSSVESMAITIAGFFSPTLQIPSFGVKAEVNEAAIAKGRPVVIQIDAKDEGHAAPDSLVEMEIWDDSGSTVYKQHQAHVDFQPGKENTYKFSWTPTRDGRYSINIGIYGPNWMPSYAWKVNAASITVR